MSNEMEALLFASILIAHFFAQFDEKRKWKLFDWCVLIFSAYGLGRMLTLIC